MAAAESSAECPPPAAATAADASQQQLQQQSEQPLQSLQLPPGTVTLQWCLQLQRALHSATWAGVHATQQVLPAPQLAALVRSARRLLKAEPTLLELQPAQGQRVTVVGDTHGQFHDLCKLFERFGHPNSERLYIFNGDYVDRGAWGVETLALLLAWKLALPRNVLLLRGNHECSFCTAFYGFATELQAKYGSAAEGIYADLKGLFAALPLAALVGGSSLILHGGLFRAPVPAAGRKKSKKRQHHSRAHTAAPGPVVVRTGGLSDLRAASKGGPDPDADNSVAQLVASDVLWSDPSPQPGQRPNELRGVGTVFGPDVTEAFLSANGLRLIIRSHEGPDARDKRAPEEAMPPVDSGYAVDHDTPSGQLVTLFSAPDYPQFLPSSKERYANKGAVAHLSGPDYATPMFESFDAALPRPQVSPYIGDADADIGDGSDERDES